MTSDTLRATLTDLERQYARAHTRYMEAYQQAQKLKRAVEALRALVGTTPVQQEIEVQTPEANGVTTVPPKPAPVEGKAGFPIMKESVQRLLAADPREWTMPELLSEIGKRDWLNPELKAPKEALRQAINRLIDEGQVQRIFPNRYRLRVELEANTRGQEVK